MVRLNEAREGDIKGQKHKMSPAQRVVGLKR